MEVSAQNSGMRSVQPCVTPARSGDTASHAEWVPKIRGKWRTRMERSLALADSSREKQDGEEKERRRWIE
eukprot:3055252-Amphidinium_carterae.1